MSGRGQAGSSSWEYGSSWDGWDYGYGGSWDEGEEQGEEVGKGKGGGRRTTVQAKGRQGGMALRARFEDGTQERTRTQAEREAIRAPLLRDIKDLKARLATAQSEGDHAVRELTLCQGFNKDYKQRAEMAEGRLRQANLDLMAAKAAEEVLETSKADYKKQLEDCKTMVTSLEASLTAKEKELHAAQACSDEKDKELKEAQAKEKELRAAQACIDEKDKELKEAQAALQQKDKDLRAIQENKAKWKLEAHAMKHARKEVARMVENDMLVRCNTLLARKDDEIQVLQHEIKESQALVSDALKVLSNAKEMKTEAAEAEEPSPTSPANASERSATTEVVSRQSDSESSSDVRSKRKRSESDSQ